MYEFIRVERQDRIAVVYLDRPKMNVLNRAMQEEIKAVALEVSSSDEVRAVVIYGGERTFAAGADIKEMIDWDGEIAIAKLRDYKLASMLLATSQFLQLQRSRVMHSAVALSWH